MEGLIPMVFKAIKKNRTRRHYECLSPSSSSTLSGTIAAAHSYQHQHQHNHHHQSFTINKNIMVSAASSADPAEGKAHHHHRHRRHHTAIESDLHRRRRHHDLDHDHDIHHQINHTGNFDGGINYYNYGIGGDYNDPQIYEDAVMYQQQQQPTPSKQLARFSSLKLFSCVTGAAH